METFDNIIKEIRQIAHNVSVADEKTLSMFRPGAALEMIADRLDEAYKRDVQAIVDANETAMKTAMNEVTNLHASLDASANTLDEYREENARLKAALKPVLECSIEKFLPGHETYAVEPFFTSATVGVEDDEGDPIDPESIATALNAVREAQRIYDSIHNGGEA